MCTCAKKDCYNMALMCGMCVDKELTTITEELETKRIELSCAESIIGTLEAERDALKVALEEALRCYDVWFKDLQEGRLNCYLSDYWSSDKVDIARNAIKKED